MISQSKGVLKGAPPFIFNVELAEMMVNNKSSGEWIRGLASGKWVVPALCCL